MQIHPEMQRWAEQMQRLRQERDKQLAHRLNNRVRAEKMRRYAETDRAQAHTKEQK